MEGHKGDFVNLGKAGFLEKRILDKKSELRSGKLDLLGPLAQPPKCPECTSQKVWKDGLRYTKQGEVQRYLCRSCGYRFSEPNVKVNVSTQSLKSLNPRPNLPNANITGREFPVEKRLDPLPFQRREDVASHNVSVVEKPINTFRDYNRERRVCVSEIEAKNLSQQQKTRQKRAAGATNPTSEEVKGKIVEHTFWLLREGYKETTSIHRGRLLRTLMKRGANLSDGESVKETIAKMKIQDGTKLQYVATYATFCVHREIQWKPPKYRQTEKIPFIPTEEEIDQLITACANRKTATLLQTLKETAMRIGEAWRLKWVDIDFERNTLTLNLPEKRGNARIFKISPKLKQMLLALPNHHERVFGYVNLNNTKHTYLKLRKRIAKRLQNPRILRITFHTFRHWKATMEYHHTKDIIHVMKFLGHRDIRNTMRYINIADHVFKYKADEYTTRVAKNVKGARVLLEAGFEYVMDRDGVMIFRKRK